MKLRTVCRSGKGFLTEVLAYQAAGYSQVYIDTVSPIHRFAMTARTYGLVIRLC